MNSQYNGTFQNKKVLVTGATGLIGRTVVSELMKQGAEVLCLVRDAKKAERIFNGYDRARLHLLIADVCDVKAEVLGLDYIIHGASQTASKAFVQEPVETVMTALYGTRNLLEFARVNMVKGFIYISSMEVYGTPSTNEKIYEDHGTNLDTMQVRACYPESKRMCENLCRSYAAEYNIPAKVIRLTQTFGPGVEYDDGRVFAEFARCAIEGRDIILNTKGETTRCYLYTEDAVKAILTVLVKGAVGEAYNAANEVTYCSIYEMARLVAEKCADNNISVVIKEIDTEKLGYAPVLHMNLDTSKLRSLGWKPTCNLEEMFSRMIEGMGRKE